MRSVVAISAVCALALASSCKKSEEHAGPMPVPTKTPPPDFPVDTSKRIVVPKDAGTEKSAASKGRPTLGEEDLKELKRSLPALKDTRVLKKLEATPRSRLARMSMCSERSVEEATAAMVSALKRKKWAELSVSTPSNNDNHRSFSANLGRFRLNGTTTQGEYEGCKKSEKQTRISWSFQERKPPTSDEKKDSEAKSEGKGAPAKGKEAAPALAPALKPKIPSLKEAVRLSPPKPATPKPEPATPKPALR